jgi:TPR repeat protein
MLSAIFLPHPPCVSLPPNAKAKKRPSNARRACWNTPPLPPTPSFPIDLSFRGGVEGRELLVGVIKKPQRAMAAALLLISFARPLRRLRCFKHKTVFTKKKIDSCEMTKNAPPYEGRRAVGGKKIILVQFFFPTPRPKCNMRRSSLRSLPSSAACRAKSRPRKRARKRKRDGGLSATAADGQQQQQRRRPERKRMRSAEPTHPPVSMLPAEVFALIFRWLPWADLLRVGGVCCHWRAVASDRYARGCFFISSTPPPSHFVVDVLPISHAIHPNALPHHHTRASKFWMQQLMARHPAFGLDPRRLATFCQQRAVELRVWATHITPSPDDRWRCALSLSRHDLCDQDIGVPRKTVMARPCRTSGEAAGVGDQIECALAQKLHTPALLRVAKRYGARSFLPQLQAIADAGNAEACYRIYRHLSGTGGGASKPNPDAMRRLGQAAALGNVRAQYMLAYRYKHGRGVPQNAEEAVRYYRMAAEKGHAEAQNSLALCYRDGDGVSRSSEEAARCFRLAADRGSLHAQYNLATCYHNGEGVTQNMEEAVRRYRTAADRGHIGAQNNLGVCYADGTGVPQDKEEALRYYRLAADEGSARAQCNLGACYGDGEGVDYDAEEAVRYYRMAAEQGDAEAQYILAICYEIGEGVTRNSEEAALYCRMAARQGHVRAKAKIGLDSKA